MKILISKIRKKGHPPAPAPQEEGEHDPMLEVDGAEDAAHEASESPEFEAGEHEGAAEGAEPGEGAEALAGTESPAEEAEELKALPDEDILKEAKRRGLI